MNREEELVTRDYAPRASARASAQWTFDLLRAEAVQDSREQRALPLGIRTVIRALPAGDYSIAGYETQIACERKSLSDLTSTLSTIKSKARFDRELQKLATYSHSLIVVEAEIQDLMLRKYVAPISPSDVIAAIARIHSFYGVGTIFCGGRKTAAFFVRTWLISCWSQLRKAEAA